MFSSATTSTVKSILINQEQTENGKTLYWLSKKKFESIRDLVFYYRTYQFGEVSRGSVVTNLHRLVKPLPRETWVQELEKEKWYQPDLTKEQAEELLLGVSMKYIQ